MKNKGIYTLAIIFELLLLITGALFLLRPLIKDIQRIEAEKRMIAMIEAGQTELKNIKIPPMEGTETELLEDFLPTEDSDFEEPEYIVGYGTITIPKIELKMALMEGADTYSLQGAAGWLPTSAKMGTAGNCAVFGHRMQTYGRHFNRLDELENGDSVTLKDSEGNAYTYTVTGKEVISPDELMDKLSANTSGFNLTLVTCTPTGVGSHRLLVYAALEQ